MSERDHRELGDYADNVRSARQNTLELIELAFDIRTIIQGLKFVIDLPKNSEKILEGVTRTIDTIKAVLDLTKQIGPLATISNVLNAGLGPAGRAAKTLEDKAEDAADKTEKTFTDKVKEKIKKAVIVKLAEESLNISVEAAKLEQRGEAVDRFNEFTERIGAPADDLVERAGRQAEAANDGFVLGTLNKGYNDIKSAIGDALGLFSRAILDPVEQAGREI